MSRRGPVVILALLRLGLLVASAGGQTAPAAPEGKKVVVADFKQVVRLHGAGKNALATADLIHRRGAVYQFNRALPSEVLIIEIKNGRVVLYNVRRRLQAEVTGRQLDARLAALHRELLEEVEKQERQGGRAEKFAAEIGRSLLTPKFEATYDESAHRLRLHNAHVEIDAAGEVDPDEGRTAVLLSSMAAIAKLTVARDPDAWPPFTHLAAIEAIHARPNLRPTEITSVFRLAGPPRKLRWTYATPTPLSDRDVEAVDLVDSARAKAPFLPLEAYDEATAE